MPVFEYRMATEADLELIWNRDIAENPNDKRYISWKEEYIHYNQTNAAKTFVVLADGRPIGQGTLLLSPKCKAIRNRLSLADGCTTANVNALRIEKAYEGKGHISKLIRMMEQFALENGYTTLTIGVERRATRTKEIYFHLGYDRFLCRAFESGTFVYYFRKILTN